MEQEQEVGFFSVMGRGVFEFPGREGGWWVLLMGGGGDWAEVDWRHSAGAGEAVMLGF